MTTKVQHSASSFDFDTISAQALEACTGGDGTNDVQRGYKTPPPAPRPWAAQPAAPLTPPGYCPAGTGQSSTKWNLGVDLKKYGIGITGGYESSNCAKPQ
jgi:hypothetical protein